MTPCWPPEGQAEQYVRALPASEPNPPFLIVVDVGHTIELFADFTRQGRTYTPFPDALSHRLKLGRPGRAKRSASGCGWSGPTPSVSTRAGDSAKVTREVAARLAKLAQVAGSARDTRPRRSPNSSCAACSRSSRKTSACSPPKRSPRSCEVSATARKPRSFPNMVRSLWETMKTGGFSPILRAQLLRFNGGLFENVDALPCDRRNSSTCSCEAGEKEWRDVEPAIFGTLLERALNPIERHKLGAHYTPRAYVERLVMPTIIEPLRDEWANVQTAAVTLANEGKLVRGPRRGPRLPHASSATRPSSTPRAGPGTFCTSPWNT